MTLFYQVFSNIGVLLLFSISLNLLNITLCVCFSQSNYTNIVIFFSYIFLIAIILVVVYSFYGLYLKFKICRLLADECEMNIKKSLELFKKLNIDQSSFKKK